MGMYKDSQKRLIKGIGPKICVYDNIYNLYIDIYNSHTFSVKWYHNTFINFYLETFVYSQLHV